MFIFFKFHPNFTPRIGETIQFDEHILEKLGNGSTTKRRGPETAAAIRATTCVMLAFLFGFFGWWVEESCQSYVEIKSIFLWDGTHAWLILKPVDMIDVLDCFISWDDSDDHHKMTMSYYSQLCPHQTNLRVLLSCRMVTCMRSLHPSLTGPIQKSQYPSQRRPLHKKTFLWLCHRLSVLISVFSVFVVQFWWGIKGQHASVSEIGQPR